ncbi:DUF5017 domain-containing protein [Pedobacter africanus]|uniref:DUF5017 domain-containing protein n=1 Tax=Pedobacter africanus TaxID=151894 RepID=A0A1W1Z9C0_9SPHI|nr:DUF5017 domain-containing protein [Pedobacter africanus]SMC44791.1 protein of unknown function [Pedobacter africanus]
MKIQESIRLNMLLLTMFLLACEKKDIEIPRFDVQTDAVSYKAGEEVTFKFSGNAENVVFWSGEKGRNYAYRDRATEKGVLQTLQFTTAAGQGTQNNNLSLKISRDFNGIYDPANIAKASWTDITSRAVLAPNPATGAAGAATASGSVNISDQATAENTPVYFAFRYASESNALKPRQWTISSFVVSNTLADGTVNNVVANLGLAGFKGVDVINPSFQWAFTPNALSPTAVTVAAGNIGDAANEDWIVSVPVKLNQVSLSDYGIPIISITTLSPPKDYKYVFTAPGVYKVVFHAFNQDVAEKTGIIKEMTITILP